ncbi:MAG: DNA-3-methyladenine glycosylase 2 family protein [Pseudomonadota bacterium]|nr:DNA-3-methyladenine glycosylase 2 family protein [Pseudomonadota bacterium]
MRELGRRDRVLRRIIRAHPDVHLKRRSDPFTALARAIVGQQISVKAADAIWKRLVPHATTSVSRTSFPRLDPARVAALDDPTLREVGLSRSKASYVRDLAEHFVSGRLVPRTWRRLDDDTLIALLVDVKGIGRWTAEMFLIFHELRPDVFPLADLGLQRALARHYNNGEAMTPSAMAELGAGWQPYRSVATWYLWRSLDPVPVEY